MDAIGVAQVLSEIGYLLRFDPDQRFRAKAFSAAAWSLAITRPDLERLHRLNDLTSIEGVGAGIAKVITELQETGTSRYLVPVPGEKRLLTPEQESIGYRSLKP